VGLFAFELAFQLLPSGAEVFQALPACEAVLAWVLVGVLFQLVAVAGLESLLPILPPAAGVEDPQPPPAGVEDPKLPPAAGVEDPQLPPAAGVEDPQLPPPAGVEDPQLLPDGAAGVLFPRPHPLAESEWAFPLPLPRPRPSSLVSCESLLSPPRPLP
jgi:hypothetical protein